MDKIPSIKPGEVLYEEFMLPLDISAYRLAQKTQMPATRISEIAKGRRKITADTALRLAAFFGNSATFWMNLQTEYDLRKEREKIESDLAQIEHFKPSFAGLEKV